MDKNIPKHSRIAYIPIHFFIARCTAPWNNHVIAFSDHLIWFDLHFNIRISKIAAMVFRINKQCHIVLYIHIDWRDSIRFRHFSLPFLVYTIHLYISWFIVQLCMGVHELSSFLVQNTDPWLQIPNLNLPRQSMYNMNWSKIQFTSVEVERMTFLDENVLKNGLGVCIRGNLN